MIQAVNYLVLKNLMLATYDEQLVNLTLWASHRLDKFCITSAFRPGDLGVHGTIPCRGLDIRSSLYKDPDDICRDINEHWTYDASRPSLKCALYHDVGQGPHIHLQVCAKTYECSPVRLNPAYTRSDTRDAGTPS